MWEQLLRVGVDNAAFVFTASQPFTSRLVMSMPALFRHEWVWKKNRGSNFANTVREPFKEHETVLVFSRGKWCYNKQMQERAPSSTNRVGKIITRTTKSECWREFKTTVVPLPELRVPSSVQHFNTACGGEKVKHPTQKPVALMEYLIKTYSNEGDTVLDFTMGSGSTGVACMNLNRRFIGIEKDATYFDICVDRIRKALEEKC